MANSIMTLIKKIRAKQINDISDIPESVQHNKYVLDAERRYGLRIEGNRGFDVIQGKFFVEEELVHRDFRGEEYRTDNRMEFDSFKNYQDFLNGDIYSKACYEYCDFAKYNVKVKMLNHRKLREKKAFINYTIDDINPKISESEAIGIVTRCEITKKYTDDSFYVKKEWFDNKGNAVSKYEFKFRYFFDFVYFLKNDLSRADLSRCDGLINLDSVSHLNLQNAVIRSKQCEKLGISYEHIKHDANCGQTFDVTIKNENDSSVYPTEIEDRDIINGKVIHGLSVYVGDTWYIQRIYYVTDIHLSHRIKNEGCRNKADIIYLTDNIIDAMLKESPDVLLIGGDVSANFKVFSYFIRRLRESCNERFGCVKTKILFILGNHELWPFPGKSLDDVIKIYRELIESNGMYLV